MEEKDVQQEKQETAKPEATTSASDKSGAASTARKKWSTIMIAAVLVIAIVAWAGATYWSVYKHAGTSGYDTWAMKTFNLPVATVDGHWISLYELETNVAATQHFFDAQEDTGLALVERVSEEEIRESELDRLVSVYLLEQLAEEKGITVTDEDIDTYFDETILPQAAGGLDEVTQTLADLYNWEIEDFKSHVLYEIVLQTELEEAYAGDEELNDLLLAEAEELLNEIESNPEKSFSDFAKEYSEDPGSATDGGMLGYFGRGVMVAEFEETAFELEIGEVSEPVKTDFGYHIIKVTDKDVEGDRVEARHILLRNTTLAEEVLRLQEAAEVNSFMPPVAEAEEVVEADDDIEAEVEEEQESEDIDENNETEVDVEPSTDETEE